MLEKGIKDLAKEAMDCTREGLDRLIQVQELLEAIKNMKQNKDYQSMIEDIIEKEKMAVELIQRATIIERGLMKDQHEAIKKLIAIL